MPKAISAPWCAEDVDTEFRLPEHHFPEGNAARAAQLSCAMPQTSEDLQCKVGGEPVEDDLLAAMTAEIDEDDGPLCEESPSEHTLFVDGTWQDPDEAYWADDVQGAAHELFGSDTGSTHSWYHGPNDPLAREMAGRKLYREGVIPAWEKGKTVNILAHSHGGNVVGEMGAYADRRQDHLELMGRAANGTGLGGMGDRLQAYGSVGAQLAGLGLDAAMLAIRGVEYSADENERNANGMFGLNDELNGDAQALMMEQLGGEARALLGDARAVSEGDGSRFEHEQALLETGEFGQAVFANTPWLAKHANPMDSEILGGRLDRVDTFHHAIKDEIVEGAQRFSDDKSDAGRTLEGNACIGPRDPRVNHHFWNHDGGLLVHPKKYNHAAHVNTGEVFQKVIAAAITEMCIDEPKPEPKVAPTASTTATTENQGFKFPSFGATP